MIPEQTCCMYFAKKLKELGVKQESLFYRFQGEGHEYIFCKYYEQYSPHVDLDIKNGFSSFTSDELIKILPVSLSEDDYLFISKCPGFYNAYYNHNVHSVGYYGFIAVDEKFANCLAGLLISLLEKKLMELPNE